MSVSEWLETEFDRICEEIEAEDPTEVDGPQSELDLGCLLYTSPSPRD